MEKAAIQMARDLVEKAKAASSTIEGAASLTDIESAWSDFLTPANRIFSKLEQGAKESAPSKRWFDQKKIDRRENAVLRYIQHARNVDEHGITEITKQTGPAVALGVGPGGWRFDGVLGSGGTLRITALGGQVPGQSKFVEKIPAMVQLVPVKDRGISYDPPKDCGGKDMLPNEVAKAALAYLDSMIEEADQLASF
jgi:hypothetical protein